MDAVLTREPGVPCPRESCDLGLIHFSAHSRAALNCPSSLTLSLQCREREGVSRGPSHQQREEPLLPLPPRAPSTPVRGGEPQQRPVLSVSAVLATINMKGFKVDSFKHLYQLQVGGGRGPGQSCSRTGLGPSFGTAVTCTGQCGERLPGGREGQRGVSMDAGCGAVAEDSPQRCAGQLCPWPRELQRGRTPVPAGALSPGSAGPGARDQLCFARTLQAPCGSRPTLPAPPCRCKRPLPSASTLLHSPFFFLRCFDVDRF